MGHNFDKQLIFNSQFQVGHTFLHLLVKDNYSVSFTNKTVFYATTKKFQPRFMHTDLAAQIQSAFLLPTAEVERIGTFFQPLRLARNDFFLKEKQFAQQMGFVQTGLMREFFYHDGREVTKWISGPGYFILGFVEFPV